MVKLILEITDTPSRNTPTLSQEDIESIMNAVRTILEKSKIVPGKRLDSGNPWSD